MSKEAPEACCAFCGITTVPLGLIRFHYPVEGVVDRKVCPDCLTAILSQCRFVQQGTESTKCPASLNRT